MAYHKFKQLNDWHVKNLPFIEKWIVDPEDSNLVLHVTKKQKVWCVKEGSSRPRIPGILGDATQTGIKAARREAARLIAMGGVKAEKSFLKAQAHAEANERLRVCDVYPIWWRDHVVHLRPNSQSSYASYIATLKESPLWTTELRDLDRRDIKRWEHTFTDNFNKRKMAVVTLKVICGFALEAGMIKYDPTYRYSPLPTDEPNQPIIDYDERRKLRDAVLLSSSAAKWALLLQIDTGCRTVDACMIEVADINTDKRVWTIPAKKIKGKRKHQYFLDADMTLTALNAAQWQRNNLKTKTNAVRYLYRALIKELGITESGPHALRRLMGTDIAENDGVLAAQQHLGHASIATTERSYIKAREQRRRMIAENVARRRRNEG